MILLLGFAFLSGLITILAPCIWPILPIVLGASVTGGHKKPLGISVGVSLSFGILTLFLSYLVKLIPFDTNLIRLFAVVVIGLLGIVLIVPAFSRVLEGFVSRFAGKVMVKNTTNGFWPGFLIGIALGVVWTPCAGPILAAIATLSATTHVTFAVVLVTASYVFGVAIPLFFFATFGNRVFAKSKRLSPYTGQIQQVFGIIMILTAIAIGLHYDTYLEAKLLSFFPSYSQFITNLESNPIVKTQLNDLKNTSNTTQTLTSDLFNTNSPAPDFVGINKWLNTNNESSLSLKDLKGKVVLVDFWTYTCINCIRTLPHVTAWYDKYKDQGFVVVGVHTPEFQFEHDTQNVLNAIGMYNIHYPVAQDNDYATWTNYNNQYWPAEYLIDAKGIIRREHFGEGEYDQMEMAIQALLKEAGKKVTTSLESMPDQTPTTQLSPETYVGSSRMQYYYPTQTTGNGTQTFTLSDNLTENSFSLGGTWTIADEFATAGNNAVLNYNFYANKVYLVLRPGSAQKPATVKVFLDGKPIESSRAGLDVQNSTVTLDSDRLYNLVDLHGNVGNHILKLEFLTPGIEAFAFTFG